MADEFDVVVSDKIAPTIKVKIDELGKAADNAANRLDRLQAVQTRLGTSLEQTRLRLDSARDRLNRTLSSESSTTGQFKSAQTALQQAQLRYNQTLSDVARGEQNLNKQRQISTQATNRYANAINLSNSGMSKHKQLMDQLGLSYNRGAVGFMRWAHALLAFTGISFGVSSIIQYADAYQNLENRIKVVTYGQENLNVIMDKVEASANRARAPIDDFARSFTRFDRALVPLGHSQDEAVRMTESVAKSLALSGANAGETASALLQLSQAFNAGRLMGDEFRSVSELMPIALDSIAKELGVTRGELKALSSEGKITTEVMFQAFSKMADEVDTQFNRMEVTIGQGMTILQNKFTMSFRDSGVSSILGGSLITLSENLDIASAALVTFGTYMATMFVASKWQAASLMVANLWAVMAAHPLIALAAALAGLGTYLYTARNEIQLFGDTGPTLAESFVGAGNVISTVWYDLTDAASDYFVDTSSTAIDNTNLWTNLQETYAEVVKSSNQEITEDTGSNYNLWTALYEDWLNTLTGGNIDVISSFAQLGDAVSTGFVSTYNYITEIWSDFPNFVLSLMNKAGNLAITTLNKLLPEDRQIKFRFDSEDLFESGKKASDVLERASQAAKNTGNVDFFQKMSEQFGSYGDKLGAEFNSARASKQIELPETTVIGGEVRTPGGGGKGGKKETREEMLARVNRELNNEYRQTLLLEDARERQSKFDKIQEDFLKKRWPLQAEEAKAIQDKIDRNVRANEVAKEADSIYSSFNAPLKTYLTQLDASNSLLDRGAISLEQHQQTMRKAEQTYMKVNDNLYEFKKQTQDEISLIGKVGVARQAEAKVIAERNRLLQEGKLLANTEAQEIRNKIKLLDDLQKKQQVQDEFNNRLNQRSDGLRLVRGYAQNQTKFEERNIDSTTRLDLANQYLGNDNLGNDNGSYLEQTSLQLSSQLEQRRNFATKIEELRRAEIISEQTYHEIKMRMIQDEADKRSEAEQKRLQSASSFFSGYSSLMRTENKEAFAIGKAAATAQATIDMYASATAAYKAMAGIPVVGPALGIAAAGGAIAAGAVNISAIQSQQMPGFMDGGYTGNSARNNVAGVVHGREYVFDAASTARIGRENLDALRAGNENSSQAPVVNVNIAVVGTEEEAVNYLAGKDGEKIIVDVVTKNAKILAPVLKSA